MIDEQFQKRSWMKCSLLFCNSRLLDSKSWIYFRLVEKLFQRCELSEQVTIDDLLFLLTNAHD